MFRPTAMALALGGTLISTAAWAQQEIKACNNQITASVSHRWDTGNISQLQYRMWLRYTPSQTPASIVVLMSVPSGEGVRAVSPGYWELRVSTDAARGPVHIANGSWKGYGDNPGFAFLMRGIQISCR